MFWEDRNIGWLKYFVSIPSGNAMESRHLTVPKTDSTAVCPVHPQSVTVITTVPTVPTTAVRAVKDRRVMEPLVTVMCPPVGLATCSLPSVIKVGW